MNAGLTAMEVLRMLGSMLLVIALLLAVLWGLKRMQKQMLTSGQPGRRLQLLETLGVGTRQKLALVRVGEQEILISITPTQINTLGQWKFDSHEADHVA
jgi:flagellar biosynthetic protein FliO